MNYRSRKLIALTAVAATAALVLAGCSGSSSGSQKPDEKAPSHLSGTVSLWHYFSDREAKAMQSVVDDFEKANPDVTVKVHSGQSDDKMSKVIASGGDLDVAISSGTDDLGAFCGSGSFRDLGPYMKRDNVEASQFLKIPYGYSSFEGKQCSLPMLSDTYGLY